ncbi:MAG: SDR family oxidoreductase [Gemmatimonadota bacterium]
MELTGRTALVTGGAHRLGRVLALALADAGADIIINYNTSHDAALQTVADIEARGRRAVAIQADVASVSDVRRLVAEAARVGRLDVVVNSASVFERRPVSDITEDEWDRVLGVNLKGPFMLSQAAAPLLRADGGGVIINLLDLSAFQTWPAYVHHAVSKAGLLHLTRLLARALAPDIRVNAIAPGTVLPPSDQQPEEGSERRVLRQDGRPEDVAAALLHLVRSDFVTGDVLTVDGGRMLL